MQKETGLSVGLGLVGGKEILVSQALNQSAVLFIEPLEATIFEQWEVKGNNTYTAGEIQSLRDYLKSGGMIYLLAHGSASRAVIGAKRLVKAVLPEANLRRIPTNYSIYTSFFQLSGPLRYPYRRGFHQEEEVSWLGVFLQGRLAIVVDTEETLHVIDQWVKLRNQSRVYSKLAPAAAAQLINVIVYAAAKRLR